jgi:hypothetical protein
LFARRRKESQSQKVNFFYCGFCDDAEKKTRKKKVQNDELGTSDMGSISARDDKGDCERKKRNERERETASFFAETGLDLRAIARVIDEEMEISLRSVTTGRALSGKASRMIKEERERE